MTESRKETLIGISRARVYGWVLLAGALLLVLAALSWPALIFVAIFAAAGAALLALGAWFAASTGTAESSVSPPND